MFTFRAAAVMMILGSVSWAGDTPGINPSSDRVTAPGPHDDRPGHELCGLGLRRLYEPGKVPVVLVHGLWGFPHQWDPVVQELEADPVVRARYQFWTFSYASGDPIPFSAHLLRQSLRKARRLFDPEGSDVAFDRMVIVGHSLGGILAKMMAQESRSRIWQTVSNRPIDRIVGPAEDRQLIRDAFCYEPVPEVRRLIYIATPHRGSPLVCSLVRDLGVRICDRKSRFREACEVLFSLNGPDCFVPGFRGEYPTSLSELAWEHPLLLAVCELGIAPSVRSHSIVADLRNPPRPGAGDGLVPYSSSHLAGVDSEVLFHGHHICLNSPAVIREVRRILGEHAGIDLTSRADRLEFAREGLDPVKIGRRAR
jgi:pimeloyl-ACP methyl ester carboxylesterase